MNIVTAHFISTSAAYSGKTAQMKDITAEKEFANELSGLVGKEIGYADKESFEDMYYRTDYTSFCSTAELDKRTDRETHYWITIGENGLPAFMDMALEELKKGTSLEKICQMQVDKDNETSKHADHVYNDEADKFCIDKATGEVTYAFVKSRNVIKDDWGDIDRETVRSIADDLNTFLRYAAFPREEDDPERVEKLFEHIKEEQKTYNVARFDPMFLADGSVDESTIMRLINGDLHISGITDGEKDEDEKNKAPIDDFMDTLRVHQDKLYEREKKLELIEKQKEMLEISEHTA